MPQELFRQFDEQFMQVGPEIAYQGRGYYLYWYTVLFWDFISSHSDDNLVHTLSNQGVSVFMSNVNVTRDILMYLGNRSWSDVDVMSAQYQKIKNTFINSKAILGKIENNVMTVADVVGQVTRLEFVEDSDLKMADLKSNVTKMMTDYAQCDGGYHFTDDITLAMENFFNTIEFFRGIDKDKIWFVVNSYMHPEQEETQSAVATAEMKEEQPVATKPAYTIDAIVNEIKTKFTFDADNQAQDIGGVMGELHTMAEKYGDERIGELYYYDEQAGKFKWNKEIK